MCWKQTLSQKLLIYALYANDSSPKTFPKDTQRTMKISRLSWDVSKVDEKKSYSAENNTILIKIVKYSCILFHVPLYFTIDDDQ